MVITNKFHKAEPTSSYIKSKSYCRYTRKITVFSSIFVAVFLFSSHAYPEMKMGWRDYREAMIEMTGRTDINSYVTNAGWRQEWGGEIVKVFLSSNIPANKSKVRVRMTHITNLTSYRCGQVVEFGNYLRDTADMTKLSARLLMGKCN